LSTPRILPNPKAIAGLQAALVCALLMAGCQPAPSPTRLPGTASPTAEGRLTGTVSPTRRVPLAPTRTPLATSDLGIDPDKLDGLQVQFWHAWSEDADGAVADLVSDFNSSNPWGIVVQAASLSSYDALEEQVAAVLEEGGAPDLISAFTYQASSWQDVLVDLNEYIDDPEYGLDSEERADFFPVFWEQEGADGSRTSLPALRSGQALYYNESWAGELGFDAPPATPEEFEAQVCAAAQANLQDDDPDNDQTGGWIISSDYPAVLGWLHAYGSPVTRENGRGYQLDTDAVTGAFTFLRQLYEKGCAWLPENQLAEQEFAERRGLLAAGSLTGIPYQQSAMRRAGSWDQWTVIPFPSPTKSPTISVYGPSYMVLKSSPEVELAAWLFARWMSSPINQADLVAATSSFPLRASTLDYLISYRPSISPQWKAATDLIPAARAEPDDPSWRDVRWALSDAVTQLFRWYFTMEQLPATVQLLDSTAAELYRLSR